MGEKGILIVDMDKTLLRGVPFLAYARRRVERKPLGRMVIKLARPVWRLGVRTQSDTLRKIALWMIRKLLIREPVPLRPDMFNRDVLKIVNHLAREGWRVRIVSSAPPEAYVAALWMLMSVGNVEFVHAPGIDDKKRELMRALEEHRNVIVLDDELLGGEKELRKRVSLLKEFIVRGHLDEHSLKKAGVHASIVLDRLGRRLPSGAPSKPR